MELIIKIFKYFTIFLIGLIVLFFLNQVIQMTNFLRTIHPLVAQIFLLILAIGIICFAIFIYLKVKHYPTSIERPNEENEEELQSYKKEVLNRLNNNKILQVNGLYPESNEELVESLKILDDETEKVIMDNASWVFVSTAISQNGKLDGLITLFIQFKMIYKISKIYYQKPRLKELYKLYSNVIVTVFLITQIEEINISEHLEPIISKFSPAKLIGSIPGVGSSISLLTNMLFEGAANCFLTLRIGLITKEYCDFMNFDDNKEIRRNATKKAATMLGKIISVNSGKITKAFFEAVKKISSKTAKSTGEKIKGMITKPFVKNEEV